MERGHVLVFKLFPPYNPHIIHCTALQTHTKDTPTYLVEEEDARGSRRGTGKEVTNRLFTGTDVPGRGRRKKKRKETGGALCIRTQW